MTELDNLTRLSEDLYSLELPDGPLAPETRGELFGHIEQQYSSASFAGQGRGRIVVWFPSPPHRTLTESEKSHVHDGVVIKLAYNSKEGDDGQRQNRTETAIYQTGSPVIGQNDLTPVFETGPEATWLMMPYRDLIPGAAKFEEAMVEKFGTLPPGDLCAKDSWGLTGSGAVECCDYGRCPIATTEDTQQYSTGTADMVG